MCFIIQVVSYYMDAMPTGIQADVTKYSVGKLYASSTARFTSRLRYRQWGTCNAVSQTNLNLYKGLMNVMVSDIRAFASLYLLNLFA